MYKGKHKIVMVGGGSVTWSPTLINDLILTPGLHDTQYIIYDPDEASGCKIIQLGNMLSKQRGLECTFEYSFKPSEAFSRAEFVIVTISTGGLDAMEYDIRIPEDYGIFQTVGDTVGPGGWARGLRNIGVFADLARTIEKYSPDAVVLNYTNPMSVLTKVFYKMGKLRTVGLCHGLFEVYDILMKIFGLDSEDEIKVRFGGTNHFFWITDLKIRGEDGYKLLKKKIGNGLFSDLITWEYTDGAGYKSKKLVCSELYKYYGFLPYVADRHICEFFSCYLSGNTNNIKEYGLHRTTIEERRKLKKEGSEKLDAYLSGECKLDSERSRETAADIISSFVNGREFIDVVNLPNIGQIPNLPFDSIVETLGAINSLGFTPLVAGALPEQIHNLVIPHVRNQDMIVEAGLEGNLDKALWALYNDSLCAHLTLPEVKGMGMKLLMAHKQYLSQFDI